MGPTTHSRQLSLVFIASLLAALFAATSLPRAGADAFHAALNGTGAPATTGTEPAERPGFAQQRRSEIAAANWRKLAPRNAADPKHVLHALASARDAFGLSVSIPAAPAATARGAPPRPYDAQGPPFSEPV